MANATFNPDENLLRGKDFDVWLYSTSAYTDGSILAYGTNCSLQIDADQIEASTKFSCNFKVAKNGTIGYTLQTDSLYCINLPGSASSFDDLFDYMLTSSDLYWRIGQESAWTGTCEENPHLLDTGATYYQGQGSPTSLSLEASADDWVQCSCTITGSGAITKGPSN